MKSIIFDLDLTLVDSTIAEVARSRRDWQLVYSLIPRFTLYPGMEDVFQFIRSNGIKAAIVSTAPSVYVQRVVNHFNIPVNIIIGYHDAPRKPSPVGMFLAMQKLSSTATDAISFGDRAIDIIASNAAGIKSVACTWGTKEYDILIKAKPSLVINNCLEIINLI